MTVDYRVRLEAFEGPLDLLLHLIRRAEVDVTDIPIATIADQYLEHVASPGRINIDLAGEFLVMAATLAEIKSRMLAPPPESPGEGGAGGNAPPATSGDPRADLVRQLLEYKRFRDAADALEARRVEWQRRFPVRRAGVDGEALRAAVEAQADLTELEDLDLLDLVRAHARIVETVSFDRLGDHTVVADDTPIELHAADVLDRLRRDDPRREGIELVSLFAGRTRVQMIGLFLAVLELVRRREVAVAQDPVTLRITIVLRSDADRAAVPDADGEGSFRGAAGGTDDGG